MPQSSTMAELTSTIKILLVASVCVVVQGAQPSSKLHNRIIESCRPDKLTVYKVILHTFWTRDRFPKHFPDWRPSAQWSKLIGRSHDTSYELFRTGKHATPGLKSFAETGLIDVLEEHSQGENGIYDEFTASAITSGSGRTETEFFVDGNHSLVSIISKIVPSPDWFIGLDSFEMCVNGNWLDSITVEADPLDAGTDNGFTFTAPNWPTDPAGVVFKITSRYPSHPAGSFYYPYFKRLPAIATFQFIKVKEYELSEVFHHTEDNDHFEIMQMEHISNNEIPQNVRNLDVEEQIEEERQQEAVRLREAAESTLDPNEIIPTLHTTDYVGRGAKSAILKSIVEIYSQDHHGKHRVTKMRKPIKKFRTPRDCRVSEWGGWGSCSQSCGIGEMQRRREVTKHARRGGKLCPPLLETKWCGSARSCAQSYFNW